MLADEVYRDVQEFCFGLGIVRGRRIAALAARPQMVELHAPARVQRAAHLQLSVDFDGNVVSYEAFELEA